MSVAGDGIHLGLERLVALGRLAASEHRGGYAPSHSGGAAGRRRGQGSDVYDLRPFQDGDDPRKLDPAATARTGRAQVRTFHEDVDRTLLLVADLRGSMFWGTRGRLRSVAAAEALALEGWRAIAAGARVGLHAAGDVTGVTLPPRPREASMLDIAAALVRVHAAGLAGVQAAVPTPAAVAEEGPQADVEATAEADLSRLLDQAIAHVMPGTEVVLATGFDSPGADFSFVAEAALRKCRLRLLLVQDQLEIDPPRGIYPVRAGGKIRQVRFATGTSLREVQQAGIPVQLLSSGDDLLAMAESA